jgi:iron complex transport system substrate-binding protein
MKRTVAVIGVVLGALVLVSCGSSSISGSGDTPSGSTPSVTTADGSARYPVTVEHRYGSTTIEARPQRIVSIDTQWTDVLTALEAPLVGAALDPMVEGGRYPWQDVPDTVESFPVTDSIPFEAVAALDPDLIVITWAARDRADYDQLSQIAPTIPQLGEEEVVAWQDLAEVAGEVLGEEAAAAELIGGVDARVADLADELPGLEGRTYALANYVPGDAIYVVTDPDDGAATFFAELGMAIEPDLVELAGGEAGRVQLSLERIGELDADLLLLLTNGADPSTIPGYSAIPAVQSGAVSILDLATATALNTPTPRSLPWAIDELRPALEAAAT